eukprot:m.194421 g.194421  ORF g.194421 m.194421 type:complete len:775 (+) comp21786_c0_seq2:5457-7781(+)
MSLLLLLLLLVPAVGFAADALEPEAAEVSSFVPASQAVRLPSRLVFAVHLNHPATFRVALRHDQSLAVTTGAAELRLTAHGAWHHSIPLRTRASTESTVTSVATEVVGLRSAANTLELRLGREHHHHVHGLELVCLDCAGRQSAVRPEPVRGANLPYVQLEAENSSYSGILLGPNTTFSSLPSEASQRLAVHLTESAHFVDFVFPSPANAFSLRFSIPDAPTGGGIDAPVAVTLTHNAAVLHRQDVLLTSRYCYYYGRYPFTKNPADGLAHHFYDEVRVLFPSTFPAGTHLRLAWPALNHTRTRAAHQLWRLPRQAPSCNVTTDRKRDCGFYGINETTCLHRNCCWHPTPPPNPQHIPDCYFAMAPAPPPPPPLPPGKVPIVVDLINLYRVDSPYPQPLNSISVTEHGADPSGQHDSGAAIQSVLDGARHSGQTVWLPPGNYTVTQHLMVNNVTLAGSGYWYSVLQGKGVGIFGESAPTGSRNVHLRDFMIRGDVRERVDSDPVNGVGGALSDSVVAQVWVTHTKVGMWLDGPFDGLLITDCIVRDTTADGINFHCGIRNSVVQHTHIRNSADDGLAMWSGNMADVDNAFQFNTVEIPVLANNIAVYGGQGNSVLSNVVSDTLTQGGGLHVGNRFSAIPLSGITTIYNNEAHRTGCVDPNWKFGVGALWFYALDEPMNGRINASYNVLSDSVCEAIQFKGRVDNVTLSHIQVDKVNTFVFQFQGPGSANADHVVATQVGYFGQYNCSETDFALGQAGGGNAGWESTHCGFPPHS